MVTFQRGKVLPSRPCLPGTHDTRGLKCPQPRSQHSLWEAVTRHVLSIPPLNSQLSVGFQQVSFTRLRRFFFYSKFSERHLLIAFKFQHAFSAFIEVAHTVFLLIWSVILIDMKMLNQPCILRISSLVVFIVFTLLVVNVVLGGLCFYIFEDYSSAIFFPGNWLVLVSSLC